MKIDFYIYRVQNAFAEETDNRYIVQAHRFGTPNSRWDSAGSLVELHYKMQTLPGFDWGEVERELEKRGGFKISFDLEEFAYHKLFS